MHKRMARVGVAVAALGSLGMGGGLVVAGAAPVAAAQAAATSGGQTIQQIEALLANVESVVCLVVDIATGQGPPFGAPGAVCQGT